MTEESAFQYENRLSLLVLCVLLWFLAIIGRLTYVQIFQHAHFAQLANEQQQTVVEVGAKRGVILDRDRYELAVSVTVPSVYAIPRNIPDAEIPTVAARLAAALGLEASAVERRLSAASTKAFVWIKRKLSEDEAQRVKALDLPGVAFVHEDQRAYPNGPLASQVI